MRLQITFASPPTYTNYANFDTWIKGPQDPLWIACDPPQLAVVTVTGSTTATVSWQAGTNNARYLIRYRAQGAQSWAFGSTTATQITLSGLSSGTTYDFQLVAGCSQGSDERGLSEWTASDTLTTN